jgi:hypothetical protein
MKKEKPNWKNKMNQNTYKIEVSVVIEKLKKSLESTFRSLKTNKQINKYEYEKFRSTTEFKKNTSVLAAYCRISVFSGHFVVINFSGKH